MTADQELVDRLDEVWTSIDASGRRLTEAEWKRRDRVPRLERAGSRRAPRGTSRRCSSAGPTSTPLPDDLPHVKNSFGKINEVFVDARRSWPGADVLAEFHDADARAHRRAAGARRRRLRRRLVDAQGPGTVRTLLPFRIFDSYAHEQDMRLALGTPGGTGSLAAAMAVDLGIGAMPYVVGKKAGAPDGSTVVFSLIGAAAARRRHRSRRRPGRGSRTAAPSRPTSASRWARPRSSASGAGGATATRRSRRATWCSTGDLELGQPCGARDELPVLKSRAKDSCDGIGHERGARKRSRARAPPPARVRRRRARSRRPASLPRPGGPLRHGVATWRRTRRRPGSRGSTSRRGDPAAMRQGQLDALAQLDDLLDAACEEHGFARAEAVVAGFSQGGGLALMLGSAPLRPPTPGRCARDERVRRARGTRPRRRLGGGTIVPVLLQHGTDDPMIPAQRARDLAAALVAHDVPTVFSEYPMGHEVALESMQEARAWLDAVRAGDQPSAPLPEPPKEGPGEGGHHRGLRPRGAAVGPAGDRRLLGAVVRAVPAGRPRSSSRSPRCARAPTRS